MKTRSLLAAASTLAALMGGPAAAQPYPGQPVKLVVPFPPGGSTDIIARAMAQKLTQLWGQQVIVDNRPGAGGVIGADAVAKSPADGYTLLMGHVGTLAVNTSLYPKLPYDPLKSFAPVSMVAVVPNVLVVHPSVPVKSVSELIAYAKAHPGKLNYGSAGNGSAANLAMEYFKLQTKTDIVHVPYKGTAPSITDLVGGQITLTMTGAPTVMPHVQSGRLRALAVSSLERVDALPKTPTLAEAGVPGFEATQWYGIAAPAGTPPAVVAKLNADTRKIMQTEDMRQRLSTEGAIVSTGTPEQFTAFIKAEIAHWAVVVKSAGMRVE